MAHPEVNEPGTAKCRTEFNKRSHRRVKCPKDTRHHLEKSDFMANDF